MYYKVRITLMITLLQLFGNTKVQPPLNVSIIVVLLCLQALYQCFFYKKNYMIKFLILLILWLILCLVVGISPNLEISLSNFPSRHYFWIHQIQNCYWEIELKYCIKYNLNSFVLSFQDSTPITKSLLHAFTIVDLPQAVNKSNLRLFQIQSTQWARALPFCGPLTQATIRTTASTASTHMTNFI